MFGTEEEERSASPRGQKKVAREETHEIASEHALEVPGPVTEDDEGHASLLPEPVDPSKDPDALAALLDGLADLDPRRGRARFDEDDLLGLLLLLELCLPLGSPLGLLALAELLLPGRFLDVAGETLLGPLDRRGGGGLPRVGFALLGDFLEDGDRLAVSDVGAQDGLVRVRGRAVSGRVRASRLVNVVRCSFVKIEVSAKGGRSCWCELAASWRRQVLTGGLRGRIEIESGSRLGESSYDRFLRLGQKF